jgi:dihydroorotate dehydrogenase (fumarate)
MADLSTTYMGIPLKSPIVVAASTISAMIDRIQLAEDVGAGALVIKSLFEEQIQMDQDHFRDFLKVEGHLAEVPTPPLSPTIPRGVEEHLMWVERTRERVKMPLIASLNAVSPGAWVEYARRLEQTGVDGLELNIYAVPTDPYRTGAQIEQELYDIFESIKAEVKIPVSVKLSQFYTSVMNVATELDRRKVAALVLFNRFLQPTIDVENESLYNEMSYSTSEELKIPLRWTALLHSRVAADLALTTGVNSGQDVVRAILAGATVVQIAGTLFKNGIPYISTMLQEMESWMTSRGYQRVEEFRGKLSQQNCADPAAFERAHYVKLILSQR